MKYLECENVVSCGIDLELLIWGPRRSQSANLTRHAQLSPLVRIFALFVLSSTHLSIIFCLRELRTARWMLFEQDETCPNHFQLLGSLSKPLSYFGKSQNEMCQEHIQPKQEQLDFITVGNCI